MAEIIASPAKNRRKSMGIKAGKLITDIFVTTIIVILGIVIVFPIFWMIRSSLMSNAEINAYPPVMLPSVWRFSNYPDMLKSFPFWTYLKNTLVIVIPSIIGAVTTSCLAAYAFARLRFKGKKFWFTLVIGSMLMPAAVTLIPIFIMWTNVFGVVDSPIPLIVPQFLGGGAFNIFLIRQFMMTIPKELDEAATIDGASHMRTLWSILVPAIRPALIVVGLLVFIAMWNDVLGPVIYLSSKENYTLAIALNTFRGSFGTNWSAVMAASTLTVMPAILIYLIGQRYFIEGIVMTGMKN